MLLEVQGVCKQFDETSVLKDVSFKADRGQSVAIVAPSGTGKSTLLSVLGLLLQPTEGTVLIDGEDVLQADDQRRSIIRGENIGFLFQHTQLLGSLRAVDNVSLVADFAKSAQCKMSASDAQQRAKDMLVSLGLEDRIYHFPHQMSVGQKRRVATARALFLHPSLILADEPTNDLDSANSELVIDALFQSVRDGSAALVFATHDMELAARADCIVELVG